MSDLQVRRLNVEDEDELRRWYAVFRASRLAEQPDSEPPGYEQSVDNARVPESSSERADYVALLDGRLVGVAWSWIPLNDNVTTAWVRPDVDPAFRRRGVGRALVQRIEQDLPAQRTELSSWASLPADGWRDHPVMLFAQASGYAVSSLQVERRLPLPEDGARLAAGQVQPEGYRVSVHLDGVPDALREGVGHLKGLLDVDAPSGDMEWEAAPLSTTEYAEQLAKRSRNGERTLESIAVSADGEVAAYTEMVLTTSGRPVIQEGTLVLSEHRGHRLGMTVKVASLLELARLDPPNPYIVTENEETNRWMVAINEELGFEPVAVVPVLLKRR